VISTHWWEKSTTNLRIWMLMIVNGCSPNLGTTVTTGSANRPNYCGSGTSWVYFEGLRGLHELHHRRGHLGILGIVFSKKHGDHCTTFRDHWSRPFLLLSLMGLISKIFCFAAYFGMLDQIWTSYQTYSKTDKQLLDYFLFFSSENPPQTVPLTRSFAAGCGLQRIRSPFDQERRGLAVDFGGWSAFFSRNHHCIYLYIIYMHTFFCFLGSKCSLKPSLGRLCWCNKKMFPINTYSNITYDMNWSNDGDATSCMAISNPPWSRGISSTYKGGATCEYQTWLVRRLGRKRKVLNRWTIITKVDIFLASHLPCGRILWRDPIFV
jgi:hypothetical protein